MSKINSQFYKKFFLKFSLQKYNYLWITPFVLERAGLIQEKILKTLQETGLTRIEAKVYLLIAKNAPLKARDIVKSLKIAKQQLYPILKNLRGKGLVSSSIERPARFFAIDFDKALELFARAKMEEAKTLRRNKSLLLRDWESISINEVADITPTFTVIQGRKYIYSKIEKMIQEAKKTFSLILRLSELIRIEESGILDTLEMNPRKSSVEFRIITEVPENQINSVRKLLKKINPKIQVKSQKIGLKLFLFPKMALKDDSEILYFISTNKSHNENNSDFDSLLTNCSSMIDPLFSIFENLWNSSTNIKQEIFESGDEPLSRTLSIEKYDEAQIKYHEVLRDTKKEVLIITSSHELKWLQNTIPEIKNLVDNDVSVRIMSPIIKGNLKLASQLLEQVEIRHIPQGYPNTIIIDNRHIFQLNRSAKFFNEADSQKSFKHAIYCNDPEYVTKTKKILDNIWGNTSKLLPTPMDSIINPLEPFSFSKTSSDEPASKVMDDFLKTKPVTSKTTLGEVTEKEIIHKILNKNETLSNSKVIRCNCKIGIAAINPPVSFNLPRILITASQIDKKSSFGAEDRIVFHILQNSAEGPKYIPVAIISDNTNLPVGILEKGQYSNTPAAKNFCLVDSKEILFQFHGNTFLTSWTKPVKLSEHLSVPPGTIIFETYGKVRTKKVSLSYPTGTKYEIEYNCFDSFVNYMYKSIKYTGSGTDALFFRDVYSEIIFS